MKNKAKTTLAKVIAPDIATATEIQIVSSTFYEDKPVDDDEGANDDDNKEDYQPDNNNNDETQKGNLKHKSTYFFLN